MKQARPIAPRAAAALLLGALLLPQAAAAQRDHLICYKARDTASVFRRAVATLTPIPAQQAAGFAVEGCELKPRATQVCAPSSKVITAIEDGSDTPFPAQALDDIQICYRLKCSVPVVGPLLVSDQLGSRNVDRFKARRLCVPAVQP